MFEKMLCNASMGALEHGSDGTCGSASSAPAQVGVELCMDDIPELHGASKRLKAGITITLHPSNVTAAAAVASGLPLRSHILTEPQTAGGLLAGFHDSQVVACVSRTKLVCYLQACSIGKICSSLEPSLLITLT
ncbi:hypothetical protein WJX74_005085 [Apatococcus lobatus]|uniref:Uncharacterized protein n=1 Tax=Apatococcus lobatus TaxID=904363 RepID=A0AAW1QI21_9CHLO